MPGSDVARQVELRHQLAQLGNVVIAFDHGRYIAEQGNSLSIQIPHGCNDGMVMRVDQMSAHIAMSRQMKLAHARFRHGLKILGGVKAVVYAADIDLVDVEKDVAVGARAYFAQKIPLAHLVSVKAKVARYIFQ